MLDAAIPYAEDNPMLDVEETEYARPILSR